MRHGHALQELAKETGKRNWLLVLQHSAAGGYAAVRYAGQRVLRGGGKRGEVLVKVVLQVTEGILCLLVVLGKGFVRVVLCHLRVFCLTWLSLCLQCVASGFGEDAVRLDRRHLLVG